MTGVFTKILLITTCLAVCGVAYQTVRLDKITKRSNDLQQEIVDMKAAQVLTDRLREYNAEITRDQTDLNQELEVAAGYTDPLSPDILRILGRLRTEAPASSGVSR